MKRTGIVLTATLILLILISIFVVAGCGEEKPAETARINFVWPDTGPVGMELRVTGEGFGESQGKNFLDIGGEKADIVEWSDTEITAKVPKGLEADPVDVVVYIDGVPSNEFEFEVIIE